METADLTVTFITRQSPERVFQAITNVRAWWSGHYSEKISGDTDKLNDEFSFSAGDVHYSKQRLIEVNPGRKIVWLITESELSFLKKKDEWTGTRVVFEISEKDGKTQVVFMHKGLTPQIECYDSCASAWAMYLQNNLWPLINTGQVTGSITK